MTRPARDLRYVLRMTWVRDEARDHWFELLIAVLAIAGMLELVIGRDSPGAPTTPLWFSIPAVAILVLPLFAWQRFPFAAPAAYWLVAAALTFVDGMLIPFIGSLGIVGLAAAFLLGNLEDHRKAGIGLVIVLGCIVIVVANIPGEQLAGDLIFIPFRFVVAWVAGYALHERSEQAKAAEMRATLAEREREAAEMRATLAEREREAAARIAVAEERARIARELHDIVAHAMSVMVLQVGAVRHKLPKTLDEDRDALATLSKRAEPRSPRCAACSERCAATETRSSSARSPGSTRSTHCSKMSAAPACRYDCMWRESPIRSRGRSISPRIGSCRKG